MILIVYRRKIRLDLDYIATFEAHPPQWFSRQFGVSSNIPVNLDGWRTLMANHLMTIKTIVNFAAVIRLDCRAEHNRMLANGCCPLNMLTRKTLV